MGGIGRWAGRVLLAGALMVLVVVGVGPLTGAYRLATVLSGSMAPGMPVGSVAVLAPEDPADVYVGDVITFQAPTPDHPVVTHRVVEILEGGHHPVLRTKGDANRSPDPWTARLAGGRAWRRVAVIPYAGTAIRILRSEAVHHVTVQVIPAVLLAAMLLGRWWPGRLSKRQAVALLAIVALVAATPSALAGFSSTASAMNTVASASDYVAPTVGATVIGKLYNSSAQYLAGTIRQGGTYYVYGNVTDSGNPATGVSTVTADVSAVTSGSTAVTLTAGSYSVNGVSYGYRTGSLTANGSLSEGAKSYTITSTDAGGHSRTQSGYTVTIDNNSATAFAASDVQTANHAGGTAGTAEQGDTITFTFNKQVDPQSILSGWSGASTSVVVRLQDGGCVLLNIGCSEDTVQIYNSTNTVALPFGTVHLNATNSTGGGLAGTQPDTLFGASGTASTMVPSGSTITITLGTRSGSGADNGSSTTMTWNPSTSPYDAAGNQMSSSSASESGGGNKEF